MNTKNRKNQVEGEIKGNGPWARSIQACCSLAIKLKQLREQLMLKLVEEVQGRISEVLVRKALIEAEALAWSTQYPLLFLPVLAEEKVRNAGQWAGHQREILERQRALATIL
jgi:hypothetical protein